MANMPANIAQPLLGDDPPWPAVPLPEVIARVIDNRGRTAPVATTGIPLIATDCIKEDALYPVRQNLRYVSRETYDTWFRGHPEPGDVILVNKGTPGRVCQVPKPVDFCIAQDMVALRAKPDVADADYLLAALRSLDFKEQVEGLHVGTMIPHLKKTDFPHLKIPLPPLPIQRAIGRIYCDLSRKIELNRRMNRTLEDLAGALFRAWFVDFEPVVAKVAGRAPFGLAPAVAALFPATFTDSELGPIPLGWRVVPVGDVMQIHDSKRIPVSGAERAKRPGRFPYYGAASVMDYIDDYIFDGVFLLLGEDGSVVDPDGYPVTQYVWGKIWVNNHAHVITGTGGVSTEMLLLFFRETILSPYVTGAVQPKLNQQNLKSVPFICPTVEISKQFARVIAPWFAQLRHNEEESRTLAALRDTLLPKLLSGELRVKGAEKLAGDGHLMPVYRGNVTDT
jgi:type I restriction enzyme S subunit